MVHAKIAEITQGSKVKKESNAVYWIVMKDITFFLMVIVNFVPNIPEQVMIRSHVIHIHVPINKNCSQLDCVNCVDHIQEHKMTANLADQMSVMIGKNSY